MVHYQHLFLMNPFAFVGPVDPNQPAAFSPGGIGDASNPFGNAQQLFGAGASPENTLPNPLGISTVGELVDKIAHALTIVAVPVVTAMVLWGAFKIITSAGNPKAVSEGGNIIFYAAVGFCLLLLADGITGIILSLFS